MFNQVKLSQIEKAFQRIFALPIAKSTFLELQNAGRNIAIDDLEGLNKVVESLLSGTPKEGAVEPALNPKLEELIQQFSVKVQLALDVMERGEFLNFATSNVLNQSNRILFYNHIRRMDGHEIQFVADIESMLSLISYFVSRVNELDKLQDAKALVKKHERSLKLLKEQLDKLLSLG